VYTSGSVGVWELEKIHYDEQYLETLPATSLTMDSNAPLGISLKLSELLD